MRAWHEGQKALATYFRCLKTRILQAVPDEDSPFQDASYFTLDRRLHSRAYLGSNTSPKVLQRVEWYTMP